MEDFTGFRFGQIHSKDLQLVVVSSSNRYDKNLLPNNKDYSKEVPGGNGEYYFGSTFSKREFSVEVAFDSVDEYTWRRISNLFATDKLQDLVFDELPYKTYRAKLSKNPEFKFICFTDRDTGKRVYKGEGTLNFVCYFPFAYGFNKYIIRAADNYLLKPPYPEPKVASLEDNPYREQKTKIYNKDTKEFYNVENNMNTPWKGGYPTIEQVRAGELYFNSPDGEKKIIDVRDYFRNVPEWARSSKLLVTPTLDYDQDLIFLPQYSKTNYINMDTGLNQENALIGSRLLVYNPGDLPVDFELKMNHVERTFHNSRGNHFQIRRFNVQRLPIPAAVDWTGLRVLDESEEKDYKYGRRYFKIAYGNGNDDGMTIVDYKLLEDKHPEHTFIAEPIPREKLGHYIRLFYWQSSLIKDEYDKPALDFEEGVRFADRYEELYELCINDYERYELYWTTLKNAILDKYREAAVFKEESFEEFVYNYIHNPPEFIRKNPELYYEQEEFNVNMMPIWYTPDYFDINTENIEKETIFFDTDKRMLYNIINPEYDKKKKETYKNWFNYKPEKRILNDNIEKGHWFKIPPGWSLIEITPICDEDNWGGKRWLDARPFDWGYGGKHNRDKKGIQILFDKIYDVAAEKNGIDVDYFRKDDIYNQYRIYNEKEGKWIYKDKFAYEYYRTKEIQNEYKFLKQIHELWRLQKGKHVINKETIEIKGTIEEWWWYACNYIWAQFPPLYWGYADILNNVEIKYIPLFY